MLHQNTRSLDLLKPRKQVRLHLCWKQYIKRVVCLNIPRYFNNDSEFKSDVTKLLERHNVNIRRTRTKYKDIHIAFVEAFNKELAKQLFKTMDAPVFQDPRKVLTI